MNTDSVRQTCAPDGGARRSLHLPAWPVAALVAVLVVAAGPGRAQTPPAPTGPDPDRRCQQCHGQAHIVDLGPAERRSMVGTWLATDEPAPKNLPAAPEPLTGEEPGTRPLLFVQREMLATSPHAAVTCIECHEDAARLPHAAKLNRATCASSCHSTAWQAYTGGAHDKALLSGDARAPTCASCHGGHDILRVKDRRASQHRLNGLYLCGDCHQHHGPSTEGVESAARVSSYLESAHAKGITKAGLLWAATCVDCHGAHGVLPSKDPGSTVHRSKIPGTCGQCHEGIMEKYVNSVHGRKLAENNTKGAVCTDCHTAHAITRASSPSFMLDIINECGECHNRPDHNGDRIGTYYETYANSYHGQVTKLGATRAARCSDCHGAHDILPLDDPGSRVSEQNLVATCARCHPAANARFVQFDPHANHRDAKHYPVLYAVWLYFMILMSTVFTFFGVHTLLWFVRSLADRARHGRPPGHAHAPTTPTTPATAIRRFTTLDRVNHALVAITFFGLTATGIPLAFAGQQWAKPLAGLFGGVEAAGLIHRFFAILLIINLGLHFVRLGQAFARRQGPWHRQLLGPNSLLPRWKDVTDCFYMFRWFFGRGRKPSFDRWTYWEKFDYWAEVGGSFIIGGSGLLLWFPELASKLVPGWAFNIAMIVHGYEALLAIGFIFTIHFFNAHIRPGTFPVDEVIFTGSIPEEELKEQRPEEYRRLVKTGTLEALRVPAPDRARRPLYVGIALVSVSIGVILLVFIVLGGLDVI